MLLQSGADKVLSPLEIFAAIIAAAIHDYGHPGVSNNYLAKISHPLDRLYNGVSALENHSCFCGLRLATVSGLFSSLSASDVSAVRKLVVDAVLSTDLAKHQQEMDAVWKFINDGQAQKAIADHKMLISLLVKTADISNGLRTGPIQREWTRRVQLEFSNQDPSSQQDDVSVFPRIVLIFRFPFSEEQYSF